MRTVVSSFLLLGIATSLVAAPAPLPKPPVSSSGFWEIDFAPFGKADRPAFSWVKVYMKNVDDTERWVYYLGSGKLCGEGRERVVAGVDLHNLLVSEAVVKKRKNTTVEVRSMRDKPVGEVWVEVVGLDQKFMKFMPIVKPPRKK